jgi:hypothetical protein
VLVHKGFHASQCGTGTGHDNEIRGGKELSIRLPRRDFRKGVPANNEVGLNAWLKPILEVSQGFNGKGRTGASTLHIRGFQERRPLDGQADHFKTAFCISYVLGCLVGRPGRRDEQKPIQGEGFLDFHGSPEMTEMYGIESTAKKA